MPSVSITKLEVAMQQLRLAITLFLERRELVSCITLAGAAEEILGKLALNQGSVPSLVRRSRSAALMHKAIWTDQVDPKEFVDLKNRTRNELKHLISGSPITTNLEAEAVRMLDRAVENYRLLHKRAESLVVSYERERDARRRSDA
jgi:hypothetical protein